MLLKKMLRDIGKHKAQFISIFIMSFLGVFIYSGITGEWMGLRKIVDEYYEETNSADYWIYGENILKSDIEEIKSIPNVKDVEGRVMLNGRGDFKNNPEITFYLINDNKVSKPKIIEGSNFDNDKNGIWLDSKFAEAKKIKVGDKIGFYIGDIRYEKIVKALVISPEYVYKSSKNEIIPNHNQFGFAFLAMDDKLNYNNVIVKTNGDISKDLQKKSYKYITKEDNINISMFQEEIKQHRAMAQIFPMVFLLIAVLTILTTMTRIVNKERIEIGTLKALGFKKKKIMNHYISYGLYISLSGSLLGAVLGPLTLPNLFFQSLKGTYILPTWKTSISIKFIIVAFITTALCVIATMYACRNNLKDTPAATLRPKSPKISKIKIWRRLGFNLQWNIRDILRSKTRSIMAIVGVLGCTALLVTAFGMKNSLDNIVLWQYEKINQFNSKIILGSNITDTEKRNIENKYKVEGIQEGSIEIQYENKRKSVPLLVKDKCNLIKETDINGDIKIEETKGISISYKLSNTMNIKVGDNIKWRVAGEEKWNESTISTIHRDPTVQGLIMDKKEFENYNNKYNITSYITKTNITEVPKGATTVKKVDDLKKGYTELISAMESMILVLIFAAVGLGIIVLYNLGVLSFTEMEREIATLKVIGFKTGRIRGILLVQNIILTTIGIIIGIPIGIELISYIMKLIGDSFDMMVVLKTGYLILSIAITFIVSIFVNLLFSRKIKKIDMVSALKSTE